MSHVFISYSRRDKETVDQIVNELERAGLTVWIDREDIKAGNSWRVQIVEAIDTCAAFVLVLSPHSALSDNVRKEIDLAQDAGRKMFIMMLEPVKLPAEIRYQLAGLQFIDVQAVGYAKAVEHLVSVTGEHLAKVRAQNQKERQVELVIGGIELASFGKDQQAQLLAFLANLTNADPASLKIASLSSGSVHAFVVAPNAVVFMLKSLALNRDARLKRFGIVALKISGDLFYANVLSGAFSEAAKTSWLQTFWANMPAPSRTVWSSALTMVVLLGFGILAVGTQSFGANVQQTKPVPIMTVIMTEPSTATATFTTTATPLATTTFTATATPTSTDTPTITPTPTVDRSANSILVLVERPGSQLSRCQRIRFAGNVVDPEGIKAVLVRFKVLDEEPSAGDFSNPDAELSLTNEGGDLWGGYFNDAISQFQRYTFYWFVVIDQNGVGTFYYEPGNFNYFANEFGCVIIPG